MKKIITTTILFCLLVNFANGQENEYKTIEKNTMEGTKVGVTKNGKEIIPAEYDALGEYSSGKFVALKNQKVGVIDTLNKTVIPFKYSFITNFIGDRTFLAENEKLAMADDKGNILTKFEFDEVLGYENGIARILKDNKVGYVDKTGKMIIQPKFNEGYDCFGNFILVYTSSWKSLGYQYVQKDFFGNVLDQGDVGMSGKLPILFSKKGEILYKGQFGEKIKITPNEKLAVSDRYLEMGTRESKIIDSNGKILHQFDGPTSVSIENEWIRVSTNTGSGYKVGIIDFNGKEALKQNFSDISNYRFNNGTLAKVKFPNGAFFYINKNVECVEFEGQSCPE